MKTILELYDEIPSHYKVDGVVTFRGFRIVKSDEGIELMDIRTPMFSSVKDEDLIVLQERGFLKGATYLLMLSDKKKIDDYKVLISRTIKTAADCGNPRKKQEHLNNITYYRKEVEYYKSQVSRWQKFLKQD